ncbi:hypothetical protein D3C85_1107570 [compost metagenome]
MLDVLRHHQAALGEHPVQAAHGNPDFTGDQLGAQFFVAEVGVDEGDDLAELPLMGVCTAVPGADARQQQTGQGIEHGLAFLHVQPFLLAGVQHQLVGHRRQGAAGRDARGAVDGIEVRTPLDHLARKNQRQLSAIVVVDHVARTAGVDQGDVATAQLRAVVALLQLRAAAHLEHRVVVAVAAGADVLAGAVQMHVRHVDHTQVDRTAAKFRQFAVEIGVQRPGIETPTGLVHLAQPTFERLVAHRRCCNHVRKASRFCCYFSTASSSGSSKRLFL